MPDKCRIGIMTFHWAANYGAVLQAFALQQFLEKELGCDADIIDYYPRSFDYNKRFLVPTYPDVMLMRFREFLRHRKLEPFRKQYLNRTKYFGSTQELRAAGLNYDVLICGSDQIWNQAFTSCGEGTFTTAYYLDFGGDCKRVSYAVSFGCEKYDAELSEKIRPLIERFNALGVREKSGQKILQDVAGVSSELVCDPTMLADKKVFDELITVRERTHIGIYMLRTSASAVGNFAKMCAAGMDGSPKNKKVGYIGMTEWLQILADSRLFITNSFHGMMMAIRLHVNFAVVLETGSASGMNDRFITTLRELGLEDHIISEMSSDEARRITGLSINWDEVESKAAVYRKQSVEYLKKAIG